MKKITRGILTTIIIVLILALLTGMVLVFMAFRYNGKWKMEAYGFCFDINGGVVKAYEVTDKHYTRMKKYDGFIIKDTLYSGIGKFSLDKEDDRLILTDKGSQVVYPTIKMSKSYFDDMAKVSSDDPVANFDMFYEILKENYAFADMYGVNFDDEYEKWAPLITADTSDETLYTYMCSMVEKLDDGHVEISWRDKEFSPSDHVPKWITDKDQLNLLANTIKGNYVKDYYKFKDCYIRYGTLREDTGYIIIQGLGMEELNKSKSTKKAMDKIIKQFESKKTIVIDLRFCGGGFDEASLLIAGYFTQDRYLSYKKQAYYKGTFTELQDIYVNPSKLYYQGDIVILTSGYTISAGETLIRSMLANPKNKITIVGEKTAGYYSDSIPKVLPGGFSFGMSTERFYWYEDTMLEGKGIVPEVEIPVDIKDAEKGIDKALDWVLKNY